MVIQWEYVLPGLIIGTMGWMIYLAGLPAIGIVAGGGAGAALGYVVAPAIEAVWAEPVLMGIGGVMGAVVGFLLIRAFQFYLFFVAGAVLGGALGFRLLQMPAVVRMVDPGDIGTLVVVAVLALLSGILFVRLRRFIVAAVTSIIGVMLLVPGLPQEWQAPGLVISLVVFLAVQIGLVRRFVDQEKFDRHTRQIDRRARPDTRRVE